MKLSIVRKCHGYRPHFFDEDGLWATRGDGLYCSPDLGRSWRHHASIQGGRSALIARFRVADRLLHASARQVVRLGDGGMVAFTGTRQHHLPPGARRFSPMPAGPVDYRPVRRGVNVDADGRLQVGDYRDNFGEDPGENVREPVHIRRCMDPARGVWETLYTFGPGTVRHVHAVIDDPFVPGRSWVCTGDTDEESVISYSDDGLQTLTPFAAEGQRSRAVDLLFTPTHLIWGVDSPLQQSGVVRKPRDGGATEWLQDTPCPVYYGAQNEAGHLFMTTCVEPGPAVTSDRVEVYASTDGVRFESVLSRRADPSPQYAQIFVPHGIAPGDHMVVYFRATVRWENTMVVGRLV
ncbi:MAG: hypothetical protein AAFV53_10465 [Myxococcota bacterium]